MQYETITVAPVVQELQFPLCDAKIAAAFQRRYNATSPFAESGGTGGKLHIRIAAADSTDLSSSETAVVLRQPNGWRRGQGLRGAEYEVDSLPTGPVVLEVLAIGFDRWRDTVLVRNGFADTIVAGLSRFCRRPG